MDEDDFITDLQYLYSQLILMTKKQVEAYINEAEEKQENIPRPTEQQIKNISLLTRQAEQLASLHKNLQQIYKLESDDQTDGETGHVEQQREELARRLVSLHTLNPH